MIEFDFDKVRGRIREKIGSEAKFAEMIGTSPASLSAKFNNKSDFTATEIIRACDEDVLDISLEQIGIHFFKRKVELNSRNVNQR